MITPYESGSLNRSGSHSRSISSLADYIRYEKDRRRLLRSASPLLILRYIELRNSWITVWREIFHYAVCDTGLSRFSRNAPICHIRNNVSGYEARANSMSDQPNVMQEDINKAVASAMSARDVKEIKDGLENMGKKFDEFLVTLAENYVTKTEFMPVKNIVYGAVAIVLSSFMLALFYWVAHTPQA